MNKIVTLAVLATAAFATAAQAATHTVSIGGKTYSVEVEGDYLGTNMPGVASVSFLIDNGSWTLDGSAVANGDVAAAKAVADMLAADEADARALAFEAAIAEIMEDKMLTREDAIVEYNESRNS